MLLHTPQIVLYFSVSFEICKLHEKVYTNFNIYEKAYNFKNSTSLCSVFCNGQLPEHLEQVHPIAFYFAKPNEFLKSHFTPVAQLYFSTCMSIQLLAYAFVRQIIVHYFHCQQFSKKAQPIFQIILEENRNSNVFVIY